MSKKPNIVFLLNDHQAYYRHGWDSGPQVQRPHFDRLASGGVEFDRAYTACPLCGPARRTMLTGLLPHNHGEVQNDTNHPFDRANYLDLLASDGYRNYYYGKWHAGPGTAYDHQCEGFSYPSYGNPYKTPEYEAYCRERGLPEARHLIEYNFMYPGVHNAVTVGQEYSCGLPWCNECVAGITTTPKETHEAYFLANLACDKLRELAQDGSGEPFSLRVDFWGPHLPYFATREFVELYDPKEIPEYGSFADNLEGKPDLYRREKYRPLVKPGTERLDVGMGEMQIPNPMPWADWQRIIARSYAQTTLIDAAGGLILDTLKELGFADNTLVIWTTDHGDALASHGGHLDKQSYMSEEVMRIPMALRYPGAVPPDQKRDDLVSNIDVAPTLLDAAGIATDGLEMDGRSLLPLCSGEESAWRGDLMCETHGHMEEHLGRLLVTDRYKYIANRGHLDELYDLENDPYELKNLINEPSASGVLEEMQARLKAWREKTADKESLSGAAASA